MSKKQAILAAFGFTKSVSHRGQETAIEIPKTVSIEEKYKLKCLYCMQTFKNQQGLSVHIKCKHGNVNEEQPTHETSFESQTSGETSGLAMPAQSSESEVIEILETIPSVERRRGSDVRKSFNNRYKAHAISLVESGEKAIDVAEHLNVSRGQISKWLKLKDNILEVAVDENKKVLTRLSKPSKKYNKLYKALNVTFLDARSRGQCVDFSRLWSKARVIYREQKKSDDAVVEKRLVWENVWLRSGKEKITTELMVGLCHRKDTT